MLFPYEHLLSIVYSILDYEIYVSIILKKEEPVKLIFTPLESPTIHEKGGSKPRLF